MTDPTAPNLDQQVVNVLQALAQPTRLRIIDLVSRAGPDGIAAGAIARAVSAPASTLSFHLKELAQAGILEARPQGRFIYYATRAHALRSVADFVARWVPKEAAPAPPAKAEPVAAADADKAARRAARAAKPKGGKRDEDQLSIFGE